MASKFCWSWNSIYVKSNGRVPCWCNVGEQYTVCTTNGDRFVDEVVNCEEMRKMRIMILRGDKNYIDLCDQCCCMVDDERGEFWMYDDSLDGCGVIDKKNKALSILDRVHKRRSWPYGSIDAINTMQIEPSFLCSLNCAGCLHARDQWLDTENTPYLMPYEMYSRILKSLMASSVSVNLVTFIGRGEPTLNPSFPAMIDLTKRLFPYTRMAMDTNCNQRFMPAYSMLNWINCSVDGSTPESYSLYRRGGDFHKAIQFMREGVAAGGCKIKWKYILFNTTDSIELMNRAQHMAANIGVDELVFTLTVSGSIDGTIIPSTKFKTLCDVNEYIDNNRIFRNTRAARS